MQVIKKLMKKACADENALKHMVSTADYKSAIAVADWISQLENSI